MTLKVENILITFFFSTQSLSICQRVLGPFKSYIDKRYSFEQLLLLCYFKVNESKEKFDNHMFITRPRFSNSGSNNNLSTKNLDLPEGELHNRLMASENLSLCYFLNKTDGDGKWMIITVTVYFTVTFFLI